MQKKRSDKIKRLKMFGNIFGFTKVFSAIAAGAALFYTYSLLGRYDYATYQHDTLTAEQENMIVLEVLGFILLAGLFVAMFVFSKRINDTINEALQKQYELARVRKAYKEELAKQRQIERAEFEEAYNELLNRNSAK